MTIKADVAHMEIPPAPSGAGGKFSKRTGKREYSERGIPNFSMKSICNSLSFRILKRTNKAESLKHALDTNKIYRIETC